MEKENKEFEMNKDVLNEEVYEDKFLIVGAIGVAPMNSTPINFDLDSHILVDAITEQRNLNKPIIYVSVEKDKDGNLMTDGVGVLCKIVRVVPKGKIYSIMGDAYKRVNVERVSLNSATPVYGRVWDLEILNEDTPRAYALLEIAKDFINNNFFTLPHINKQLIKGLLSIPEPNAFVDIVSRTLVKNTSYQRQIFIEGDTEKRLEILNSALADEMEVAKIKDEIAGKVQHNMAENQREYILREQMKAISDELGENIKELDEIEERIKNLPLAESSKNKALKEINRLKKISNNSPEYSVILNWLDTLLDLPWGIKTEDNKDLKRAQEILNEDHAGLKDVKDRILEYLAVMQLTKKINGQIICFVGPPGVGKTSIAKSIARATNRNFVKMSVGGVKDESEIRGHRRTYVGAMPGRLIYNMIQAKSLNPVFLIDEIDKMSSDYKGDPASAMLEVLDPEQNNVFRDHFVEVPFDLSDVLFICTANDLGNIPAPLRDRMEVIELGSYTPSEKAVIAKKYLLPKAIKQSGLEEDSIIMSDETIDALIDEYSIEAGVRGLERKIFKICRKVALEVVKDNAKSVEITKDNLKEYLGARLSYRSEKREKPAIGLINGMAYTAVGGDILTIETNKYYGEGKINLTGHLGDVLKESAQVAYSAVKMICTEENFEMKKFKESDLHIHIPEGAVPKDGPSAGVALALSIYSAMKELKIDNDLAVTGEITTRGNVLAIGGLKEKLFGCIRAGITKVIVPLQNKESVEDLDEEIKSKLKIHFVSTFKEAIDIAIIKEND